MKHIKSHIVLGLMSGTSMDGLDCCLSKVSLDQTYQLKYEIIDFQTFNYSKNTKMIIKNALTCEDKKVELANKHLGTLFLEKSKQFINNRKVDLIGSHGQTIFHSDKIKSIQIGDPILLKKYFKIPVICNFREKDILNGGNGDVGVSIISILLNADEKSSLINLLTFSALL